MLLLSWRTAFTTSYLEHVTSLLSMLCGSFDGCAEVHNRDQDLGRAESICGCTEAATDVGFGSAQSLLPDGLYVQAECLEEAWFCTKELKFSRRGTY